MDIKHVIKRIRNNISKSDEKECNTKELKMNNYIFWSHLINAYTCKWDNDNAFQLHHKLKDEHFYLNSQLKMRNKLAGDVLDENMLILMKSFQIFLGTQVQL